MNRAAGWGHIVTRNPLVLVLVPMVVYFQLATGQFFTSDNIRGIALDSAVLAIIAVPGALLLISGYLDLSVGSTLSLGAVVAASFMVTHGSVAAVAIIGAVVVGALVGVANGLLCSLLNLSPFIVTLGTLTAVRGLDLLLSPLPLSGFGDSFDSIGGGVVAGVPVPVIIAAAVIVSGSVYLAFTPSGRYVYAIGVNREAAFLSGIAVRRLPLLLYVASGAAAALAGVIQAARLDSAPAGSLGTQFELTVLTAVLLGGVAFTGGAGSIFGVVLGVLFLGCLQNGLTQLNVPDAWQQIIRGLALVAAAGLALFHLPSGVARRLLGSRPAASPRSAAETVEPAPTEQARPMPAAAADD